MMVYGKIIKRIKYWGQLLLLPVYGLSFLFHRDKNIWLFGSGFGQRFADNPRYFYLYLSQHPEVKITPIWISGSKTISDFLTDKGYCAYYKNSLRGLWYCLRGGVYLYDNYPKDISHFLSGGAKKVNLWHGLPLKKIQMNNTHDRIRHPKDDIGKLTAIPRRLSDEKPSHYVLTSSDFFAPIFASAFQTNRVLVSGYPRCDIFCNDAITNLLSPIETACYNQIAGDKRQNMQKMILYMPTFRDSETKFFDIISLDDFQVYLEEHKYLFCVKLHCKSKLNASFMQISRPNICVIPSEADPYCFIELSDLLVTDYSSIYFDYLLTDKPMLFFDYDYQEYISQSRDLYYSYEEFTPGEKVRTMPELETAMIRILTGKEEPKYRSMRKDMKEQLYDSNETSDLEHSGSEQLYRLLLN